MTTAPAISPGMLDVLRELMNIGVGRAARAISELSGREVALRVLEVTLLDLADLRQLSDLGGQINLRVSQTFRGPVGGYALFALNRPGAVRLARLLLDKAEDDLAFDELEQSALLELGNIVIGSALGMLASELRVTLRYDLPQLQLRGIDTVSDLFADLPDTRGLHALVMRASLSLREDKVNGYLIILFPEPGLKSLADRVARLAL
jgi:chemotaxis protein CheC